MSSIPFEITERASGSGPICREILAGLSEWFGLESSNESYVELVDCSPTLIAELDGRDVGLLHHFTHSRYTAEIDLMAVLPEFHRMGIGRALVERAESDLAAADIEFVQVKTLSSRRPHEGYARTRAFYEALGFRVLEEFPMLWNADNPAAQMIKAVGRPTKS